MPGYIQVFAAGGKDVQVDHVAKTGAKALTNADPLFIAVGDVQILSLRSECYTTQGALVTTLQYQITKNAVSITLGLASASLANDPPGASVILSAASTLTEAMFHTAAHGVSINTASRGIVMPNGAVLSSLVVNPSTGTWKHYIKWEPLEDGAIVVPQF